MCDTQGDVRFATVMGLMGAKVEWSPYSIKITGPSAFGQPLVAVDHDCNDIPDAAMTLAVAALFAQGTTRIRNVYNWRVKETERMVAIVTELRKLGATVREARWCTDCGMCFCWAPTKAGGDADLLQSWLRQQFHSLPFCLRLCQSVGTPVADEYTLCVVYVACLCCS